MRRTLAATLALALAPAGCAAPEAPRPVALSYPDPAPWGGAGDPRALAERVAPAWVRVLVFEEGSTPAGPRRTIVNGASGTVVGRGGFVVTPAHIAKDRRFSAEITTIDGRVHPARILDVSPSRELALLRMEGASPPPPPLAPAGTLRPGAPVLAIGTPDNRPGVVSAGRVLVPRLADRITYAEYGYDDAIALEMEVGPGDSGGPVFDAEGRLVGMLASFALGDTSRVPYVPTRLAYAIPASAIGSYLREVNAAPEP